MEAGKYGSRRDGLGFPGRVRNAWLRCLRADQREPGYAKVVLFTPGRRAEACRAAIYQRPLGQQARPVRGHRVHAARSDRDGIRLGGPGHEAAGDDAAGEGAGVVGQPKVTGEKANPHEQVGGASRVARGAALRG